MIAFQLFTPDTEQYAVLQEAIKDIELMVLDEEQIASGLSLYDLEMAIESNADYYSFFVRNDGQTVSKFDVERELNKVKAYIYAEVGKIARGRKFQRYR
jgi:hypothetical protein